MKRRPWCRLIFDLETTNTQTGTSTEAPKIIQICDFEMIEWDPVLKGLHHASSYIIRKGNRQSSLIFSSSFAQLIVGLSRKAQLALQLRRYVSKHPTSILTTAIPYTEIVQTWNAFEDMKLDFGGGFIASFDTNSGSSFFMQSTLRERLGWALADIQEEVKARKDWIWILKPSVTNKGTNISVHNNWEGILDALEDNHEVREWVLQRSIIPSSLYLSSYQ